MEKRYQIFVSSTYQDLQKERHVTIQALLALDCFPAGMELFPAADEDQWTLIKDVIDQCDYYLLISAGRYGDVDDKGVSYTEKEYRYALAQKKPIIAFLHKNLDDIPQGRTDKDAEKTKRLHEFRNLAKKKTCKFWTTAEELGLVVSASIGPLMKKHPAVGWIRADRGTSEESTSEIFRLTKRVRELESELARVSVEPPSGSENLAQGSDEFSVSYTGTLQSYDQWGGVIHATYKHQVLVSWDEVFGHLAPYMMQEESEEGLLAAFNDHVKEKAEPVAKEVAAKEQPPWNNASLSHVEVPRDRFHKVIIQLRALGLIEQSLKKRSANNRATYWTLTPLGDRRMVSLLAIIRDDADSDTQPPPAPMQPKEVEKKLGESAQKHQANL